MPSVPVVLARRPFGVTMRRDRWWIPPLVVFLGLSTFLVYATWAALQNASRTQVLQSSTCRDQAARLSGRPR